MRAAGTILCVASAAAFGAMAIFGKLAYDEGATVGTVLPLRFALAAALLWAALLAGGGLARMRAVGRRDVLLALALGAAGYAAQAGAFFAALERIDASLLSLVLYTFPAIVTGAAILLGRERADARRLLALLLGSGGLVLVVAGARAGALDPLGVALGLAAALVYSAYILLSDRVAARVPPQLLATLVCTGAAGTLLAGSALLGTFEPGALTPAGWGWIGAIAFVSTVAAIALFFAGLRRVGPSAAAILSTVEPLVTIVLAAWVFGERLQPGQLVGGALILTGVVVLSAPPGTRRAVRRWALRAAAQRSAARRASASARAGRAAR